MEWLILLLLVSAVLAPVVVLCGFAGCAQILEIDDIQYSVGGAVAAPSDLVATSADATNMALHFTEHIHLAWKDNSGGMATTLVRRLDPTNPAADPQTGFVQIGSVPPGAPAVFDDPGRADGTDCTYQVAATNSLAAAAVAVKLATATTYPNAPILTATPMDVNKIHLAWQKQSQTTKDITYRLQHRVPGGQFTDLHSGPELFFDHTGPELTEGSTHEYQVSASISGFSSSSNPAKSTLESQFSPSVLVKTLAFQTIFSATLTTDQAGEEGLCIVQRINSPLLAAGGIRPGITRVRITLRGSTAGALHLNTVTISKVAPAGNPYDSAADLTPVDTAVTVPAGMPFTLPVVNYPLDQTQDLIIAFDVGNPGNGRFGQQPVAGANSFAKGGTQEASKQARSVGYGSSASGNNVHFIDKIEVL